MSRETFFELREVKLPKRLAVMRPAPPYADPTDLASVGELVTREGVERFEPAPHRALTADDLRCVLKAMERAR